MTEWQPIETVPKDGTKLLAFDKTGAMGVVWWNQEEKMYEDVQCLIEYDGMITHWMPLPQPPKE